MKALVRGGLRVTSACKLRNRETKAHLVNVLDALGNKFMCIDAVEKKFEQTRTEKWSSKFLQVAWIGDLRASPAVL